MFIKQTMRQQSSQPPRKSALLTQQKDKLDTIISIYTSKQFLTKHSLMNNLFSSQQFSMACPDRQFTKLYFGKQNIQENQLHQFTYFHKRDKKMLVYFFILYFITSADKTQLIVYQNGDKINTIQLREFLKKQAYGGGESVLKQFESRVTFFRSQNHQSYKVSLHYLSFYAQQHEFLKAVILADINQFESGDKSSLQRIYKKIPKSLFVLSLKKQIYDYKFIQKAPMPFILQNQQITDHYQLHEKVTRNINKSMQGFKSHHGYLVPIEQIGIASKNLQETYRSVIIRKDQIGDLSQYIFTAYPFQLKAYRKIQ